MKDYLKKVLNEQQFQAATYVDGPSLILAWAWAGKTRTLTYKIAYIHHLWTHPENILAVTFTNKAANEMKERLIEIQKEITEYKDNQDDVSRWYSDDLNLNIADTYQPNQESSDIIWGSHQASSLDFDEMVFGEDDIDSYLNEYEQNYPSWTWDSVSFNWIGTFHSIFLKILKHDIHHLNDVLNTEYNKYFNVADESDTQSILRKILKDLWIKDTFTPREIKWKISRAKNAGLTAKDFLYQAKDEADEIVGKIYQLYEKALRTQNTLDFDDLLLLPYLLFKNKPDILQKWKSKFKYILVDEAQDTNKIQFDLMYMLSWSDGNITLIWDDFQSIYGWRWAVIEDFLNAKKYWPELKIFKLEINYRSKKTIVDAWNCIIKNNKNQYEKNIQAHNPKESKIKVISFETDVDEAVGVISLIKKLHEKWKKWSDFAIIYRTNAQSEPFEKVLLTENIPYKIYGAFKFYERKEIKDILAYIKYLVNPADGMSLTRIINVPGRKIWQTTIEKLQQIANTQWKTLHEIIQNIDMYDVSSAAKKNIKNFVQLIDYIKQKIALQTPPEAIQTILKSIDYENYLIKEFGETDAQDRMANIGQLINTASNFSTPGIEWLKEFVDEISLLTDLEEKNSEQEDKVNLMTVHASKWLEFDTVFLVGLEENIFPLSRARLNPKELEEERRLAYVWITRAKNNLFLTYAESRKQYWTLKVNPISRFVEEIPEELKTSFNFGQLVKQKAQFQIWDQVKHKLFGIGEVLEVFEDSVIVRFPGSGIKKILARMLEKV